MFEKFWKHNAMPSKFNELAEYNTRVSNGIVHTKEYQKRMKILQEEYNMWVNLQGE
ncbi:MAG: hypothetical protein AABY22_18790 [Nanoarchaeota archaeon]